MYIYIVKNYMHEYLICYIYFIAKELASNVEVIQVYITIYYIIQTHQHHLACSCSCASIGDV